MKKGNNDNLFIKINALFQKCSLNQYKVLLYYLDGILLLLTPKKEKDDFRNTAIIFNLALGDGIVFRNCLINYLKINKDKKVDLYIQKGLKDIYCNIDGIDKIIELDFNKATVNVKERVKNIKKIRDKSYETLLDPIGVNEYYTNVLMSRCFNAKNKTGCKINDYEIITNDKKIKKIYNNIIPISSHSLIKQYNDFLLPNKNIVYEYFEGIKPNIKLPKDYYVVFSGASTYLKKWPIERYAEIVKKIYIKTGLTLLLCGTNSDKDDNEKLIELIGNVPYVNIMGKTKLLEYIYTLNHAKFIITNDTSAYHIAVINQIPVTIITGGYTYDRYVTYNFEGNNKYKKPYICINKMKCVNCFNRCDKIKSLDKTWPCLDKITIEDAWKVINKMIDNEVKK